jgi:hypothetical protein
MEEWILFFCKTKPTPSTGGPLIPGDAEREAEAIRIKERIPLLKRVVEISDKTGIPFEISWAT